MPSPVKRAGEVGPLAVDEVEKLFKNYLQIAKAVL